MRRNLHLKREVLTSLNTDELASIAGGDPIRELLSDIVYRDTYICLTDTCLTDNCETITQYCTLGPRICGR